MSNIVLLVIALNKISVLTTRTFLLLAAYTLLTYIVLKIYVEDNVFGNEKKKVTDSLIKKYKLKTTLVICIISFLLSNIMPTQEELVLYFGSKYATTQNYKAAKSELLDFIRDVKKEIEKIMNLEDLEKYIFEMEGTDDFKAVVAKSVLNKQGNKRVV